MLYELPSFSAFSAAQDFIKAKATMAADPRIDTDFNFCLGRLEELYEPKLKGLLESALKAKHCIFFEDDFFTLAKPTPNLINSKHYMHLLNSLSVLVWEQFTQNKFADAVNLLVGSMYLIMGLSYNSPLRINAEYAGFGGSAIMQKCYNFALEEIEPKYFEYLYRYLSYLPSPVVNANFVVQKQRQIMLKAFENIEKDQKAIAHLFAYNEEAHHMGTTAKDAYDYHRSSDFQRDKDILIKYYDALVKVDLYGDDAYGIIMDLKHEEGRNELSEYFALNPNYILNFVQRTERLSGARDRTMEILSNYYQ